MLPPDQSRPRLNRWTAVAPWVMVAVLLHLLVLLAVMAASSEDDRPPLIEAVALVDSANPYLEETLAEGESAPTEDLAVPDPSDVPVDPIETSGGATSASTPVPKMSADGLGDFPTQSAPPSPSPGGGSMPGLSSSLGNRHGTSRGSALGRFGGSADTESAVGSGLAWLATHQDQNGAWDRQGFTRHCPDRDLCGGVAVEWIELDARPGLTGLVTLAFLGAGNSHVQGPFRDTVARAITFILAGQLPNGSLGRPDRLEMYNHAIATLAVSECYILTRDADLRAPLRGAIDFLVRAQQAGGGWDYRADLSTGRNDTSITGWALMALKSGETAGIAIPGRTSLDILSHFSAATDLSGRVFYADRGTGVKNGVARQPAMRYGPAMTAVGMLSRQLLGYRSDARSISDQAGRLMTDLPDFDRLRGGDPSGLHGYYYWYHGTMAMFLRGGSDWPRWNAALLDNLLPLQDRSSRGGGGNRHTYGSWPALGPGWGKWGRTGSRVYSTAMGVLTLETYYRYLPSYASAKPLLTHEALSRAIHEAHGSERHRLATVAAELSLEIGEPTLLEALTIDDARLALIASVGLAWFGNPLGKAVLELHLSRTTGADRTTVTSALNHLGQIHFGPEYGKVVSIDSANRLLVFDTLGLPVYLRQPLVMMREGHEIGSARIFRRHPTQHFAVAEFPPGVSPKPEDTLLARR